MRRSAPSGGQSNVASPLTGRVAVGAQFVYRRNPVFLPVGAIAWLRLKRLSSLSGRTRSSQGGEQIGY